MHPIGSWLVSETSNLAEDGFAYSQFNTPVIDPSHPLANVKSARLPVSWCTRTRSIRPRRSSS